MADATSLLRMTGSPSESTPHLYHHRLPLHDVLLINAMARKGLPQNGGTGLSGFTHAQNRAQLAEVTPLIYPLVRVSAAVLGFDHSQSPYRPKRHV